MAIIKNPLTLVKQESGGGQTTGEYYACVVDYDGTIIKEERLNNGQKFKMPTPPTHSGLVFDGWSSSQEIIGGEITINNNNFMAGPMYYTESGKHEIDIELEENETLNFEIYGGSAPFDVDWGDGTIETISTFAIHTHTYANYGNYTIKLYNITNSSSFYSYVFNQKDNVFNGNLVKEIRFGKQNVSFNVYYLRQLRAFTIHDSISAKTCFNCYNLKCYIPTNLDAVIVNETIRECYNLKYAFFNYNNIAGFGQYTISNNYSLQKLVFANNTNLGSSQPIMPNLYSLREIVIPSSMTNFISNGKMQSCYSLEKIKILSNYTTLQNGFLFYAHSLKEFTCPDTMTSIPQQCFYYAKSLESIDLPNTDITIGNSAFESCSSLKKLVFKKNVSSIGTYAFSVTTCNIYDFTHCTSIPTLSNKNAFSFQYGNPNAKILVPSTLYAQWITETNWSDTSIEPHIVSVPVS